MYHYYPNRLTTRFSRWLHPHSTQHSIEKRSTNHARR